MAPTFTSLPHEIRLQIFDYLFERPSRVRWNKTTPKAIPPFERIARLPWITYRYLSFRPQHCAILRTCRQLYFDTLPLVYAHTTFTFAFEGLSPWDLPPVSLPIFCPAALLRYVHNVEIVVQREDPIPSTHIPNVMASLIRAASTLKKIHLSFQLRYQAMDEAEEQAVWAKNIAQNRKVPDAIAALELLRMIEITVANNDEMDTGRSDFLSMVCAIAKDEDWIHEHKFTTLKEHKNTDAEFGHTWTWKLALPAKG